MIEHYTIVEALKKQPYLIKLHEVSTNFHKDDDIAVYAKMAIEQ